MKYSRVSNMAVYDQAVRLANRVDITSCLHRGAGKLHCKFCDKPEHHSFDSLEERSADRKWLTVQHPNSRNNLFQSDQLENKCWHVSES